jgi:transposase
MHYKDRLDRHQMMMLSYDSMISKDNPVRLLDAMCRKFLEDNPKLISSKGEKAEGRKAYPPVALLNLLVYGYFNGVTTSRKLEKETHRNIEVVWLTEGLQPDHWTICEFRRENGGAVKAFLKSFRRFLKDQAFISGEKIVFDGSKIKAYASREMLTENGIIQKLENIDKTLAVYLRTMEEIDSLENKDEKLRKEIEELKKDIEKMERQKKSLDLSREKLKGQDLKRIAPNDPEARLVKGRNGKFAGYNFQIGVDSKFHFIVSNHLTADVNDRNQLGECVREAVSQLGVPPKEAVADKGYANYKDILSLQNQGIECFVPLQIAESEKKEEQGLVFTYDKITDTYTCPQGKTLNLIAKDLEMAGSFYNKYHCRDCAVCPIRTKCTTSKSGRTIKRNVSQELIDLYKKKLKTDKAKNIIRKRKAIVEHPFGTIKALMGKFELVLRGKQKAGIELDLYTIAYNLKRLNNIEQVGVLQTKVRNYNWKAA